MKKICFFVNLLLIVSLAGHAQLSNRPLQAFNNSDSGLARKNLTDSLPLHLPLRLIPANYYTTHLGFFCKQELNVQKATKLPITFRLGTMDYNNYLEQKPNALKPPR